MFTFKEIAGGITQVGFTPITSVIKEAYGTTDVMVSLLYLCYTIAFIPLNFPANQITESKGISISIRASCILLLAGSWIRLLSNQSFYFILAGQALMA